MKKLLFALALLIIMSVHVQNVLFPANLGGMLIKDVVAVDAIICTKSSSVEPNSTKGQS